MKGINEAKHEHLLKALLQLEWLISEGPDSYDSTLQASEYSQKLEMMHQNYKNLLKELYNQITDYEILYNDVKVQFLGKKLKELKKETSQEKPAFRMLTENIHLAYSA